MYKSNTVWDKENKAHLRIIDHFPFQLFYNWLWYTVNSEYNRKYRVQKLNTRSDMMMKHVVNCSYIAIDLQRGNITFLVENHYFT